MGEKKVIKIKLSTVLLILAIIAIGVMGYFIYKISSDKSAEEKKSAELQAQVNTLNGTVSQLQGKMNTISDTKNYQISGSYYQKNAQGDEPNFTFSANNKVTYGALWTCSGTYSINNSIIKINFTSAVDPDGNKTNFKDLGVKETVELTIIDDNNLKDNSDEVIYSKKSETDLSQNTTNNSTVVKEIEKQLNVNDVITLGYNNIYILLNNIPYYIPVFNREENYSDYKIKEVKAVSGNVSKIKAFSLGTDPSESVYLIYKDGHVELLSDMGEGLEAHQGVLDSDKKIVDLVEENGIVYAVSQNGEKTKIAERYPGV